MVQNKLFLYSGEAREAIQKIANEKGIVFGEIKADFDHIHLEPVSEYERERMLMNFFLYERKTWHLNAFELVDGEDTYRYAYLA